MRDNNWIIGIMTTGCTDTCSEELVYGFVNRNEGLNWRSPLPFSSISSAAVGICTSSIKSLGFVTVGSLQRAKYSNIAGLELVGSARSEIAQANIVFEAKM
jgi:hypothetical protein